MGITRYQLNAADAQSVSAKLLYVTYSKYENDWSSLPHTHYFTELFYVKKGHGKFLVDDRLYPIKEDDFVIVNANVSHTEISEKDTPLEYIILGVEGLSFSFEDNRDHIIFNCRNDQSDLMFYMNSMLKEMEEKKRNYELVCQNLLEVMIVKLLRRTNFAFEVISSEKISRDCFRIKQYIDANYTSDITLDTLSEISHLNKYYLVHSFAKYFGCSPINYLCSVRIKASKELLTSTNYSISEVAQSSGFSSQSYFAQCFQKHCHMSASAYRKSFREQA
ncbi:AraC family transcriptional regulator [Candidatus Acetatifactor stercoripullorum]|uniref:AraC family transcriptional regulator n=1 Tax=Candidatus Acetatifactor stercoripullorum TaxID=2838414 RepID=UPI00298DAEC9|nr:AraC family transcriptional regulator [Candidatus Acetatifactor stercoripullorum]